jgi:nucleoside-diphosphate-sugar epimerase
MRVLITGGEGRLGKLLVGMLEDEYELTLTDTKDATQSRHKFIQGNLLDEDVCARAVEGVDAVCHLAAFLSPKPPRAYENNTVGTWNICSAGCKAGAKRILFASSVHAFGQGDYKIGHKVFIPPYVPIDENVPSHPEDAYGLSKLAGEQMLDGFSAAYDIRAYCYRLPGLWGPEGMEWHASHVRADIPLRATRLMDPWLYIDIRDAAAAFKCGLESPDLPEFGVGYVIADDTSSPVSSAELIQQYLPEWIPLGGDKLPGFAPWFSNAGAKKALNWQPQYTWRKPAAG